MNLENVTVTGKNQTKIWVEGQETCREYYKTSRITFGMSELLPGAVGDLDAGHAEADEVFYCIQGEGGYFAAGMIKPGMTELVRIDNLDFTDRIELCAKQKEE